MNLDFSDRKILAAGLVLLVVAAGLGVFWLIEDFGADAPTLTQKGTGSFSVEVVEYNLDNGEEGTTEADADSAG